MIRVVLDTNIFISAFLFGGKPARILHLVEDGLIALVFSEPIRDEVERVLAEKFHWPDELIETACGPFWSVALCTVPEISIHACVDPDDDRILECAVAGEAQCIVTGDRHLLSMNSFQGIPVLTPDAFLAQMEAPPRNPETT